MEQTVTDQLPERIPFTQGEWKALAAAIEFREQFGEELPQELLSAQDKVQEQILENDID